MKHSQQNGMQSGGGTVFVVSDINIIKTTMKENAAKFIPMTLADFDKDHKGRFRPEGPKARIYSTSYSHVSPFATILIGVPCTIQKVTMAFTQFVLRRFVLLV